MPGTTIPRGNVLNNMILSVTLAPAQVVQATTAEQAFTVLGVQVGDYINGGSIAAQTAGILTGSMRVTGANTVVIQFVNVTGGALTPVTGPYGFVVGRPEIPNTLNNAF